MGRQEIVLAALSTGGGYAFRPVQVQKLFFLIDREIPDEVGGPHFHFKAYDYGPFDPEVYTELELLEIQGLAEIIGGAGTWRVYKLTGDGLEKGEALFAELSERARAYIREASDFVRQHSFSSLVKAIYKAYPEMRKNSVFQD